MLYFLKSLSEGVAGEIDGEGVLRAIILHAAVSCCHIVAPRPPKGNMSVIEVMRRATFG